MTTYKPLDEKHRSAIMRLLSVACEMAESDRSLKKVAIRLIKFAAWRWTADAFDSEKADVKIDAIKFSFVSFPAHPARSFIILRVPRRERRAG